MKKLLSFLLSLTLVFSVSTMLGCNGPEEDNSPKYDTAYSYNDTHHWRNQINGTDRIDYAEHRDDDGRCECGIYYDATDFLEFRRLSPTEGLGDGYAVSKFLGDEFGAYVHIEVPSYYQDYEDEEGR